MFYVLLTVHLAIIIFNDQLDEQLFLYVFISVPNMLRASKCSSSGDSIVSIRYLLYVTVCRGPSGMQVWTDVRTFISDGHLHRVTYTRYHIDTILSPDDENLKARNM